MSCKFYAFDKSVSLTPLLMTNERLYCRMIGRAVNSVDNDCLRVDVWDFNPEEKVGDKFRKINEIKDSRGLRKFIKETLNATTGNITHDLIGSVEIPLNVSI